MGELPGILISAVVSFAVALGLLFLAQRAGLTDVQERLVSNLKDRIVVLEAESKRKDIVIAQLEGEIAALERRYARLEEEYERLRHVVENHDDHG